MSRLNGFEDFRRGMIIKRKEDGEEFVIYSVENNSQDNYYPYIKVIKLSDIKRFLNGSSFDEQEIELTVRRIYNSEYWDEGIESGFEIVKENAYRFKYQINITEVKE